MKTKPTMTKAQRNGPVMFLYPLFEHMSRNHNLTLLDSEMEEIREVCRRLDSPTRSWGAMLRNIDRNIALISDQKRVMTETLRQISDGKRNSLARRHARSTLAFLDALAKEHNLARGDGEAG